MSAIHRQPGADIEAVTYIGVAPRRRLVTDREFASYIHVSRSKFHLLVAQGMIPKIKLGRAARYDLADADRLIDALKGAQ
jgi:predicted DNA-binding transcriptional regulator AlpA